MKGIILKILKKLNLRYRNLKGIKVTVCNLDFRTTSVLTLVLFSSTYYGETVYDTTLSPPRQCDLVMLVEFQSCKIVRFSIESNTV